MIDQDKRKAIWSLHNEGMGSREISRRLRVSRNTVSAIISQKGGMPDGARKDKTELDAQLLRSAGCGKELACLRHGDLDVFRLAPNAIDLSVQGRRGRDLD